MTMISAAITVPPRADNTIHPSLTLMKIPARINHADESSIRQQVVT